MTVIESQILTKYFVSDSEKYNKLNCNKTGRPRPGNEENQGKVRLSENEPRR